MTAAERTPRPWLPPRWFVRFAWAAHRGIYSVTGGRLGLKRATARNSGMLRLRTVGRRTGDTRRAILGYILDGPNFVLVAMNGWGDGDPAWCLNLKAHPDAIVDLADGTRAVTAQVAEGDDRERLWKRLGGGRGKGLDAYAALRSTETDLVILEPRPAGDG